MPVKSLISLCYSPLNAIKFYTFHFKTKNHTKCNIIQLTTLLKIKKKYEERNLLHTQTKCLVMLRTQIENLIECDSMQ